jgi:peptidoglycan/xylan/chitin deacetylase (PgdA/CDA1 family)
MEAVMWNVTGYDWNAPQASVIEAKIARQIHSDRGHVILLHDGGHRALGADRSQTVIATGNLIQKYKAEDYEFVSVDEMLPMDRQSSTCV